MTCVPADLTTGVPATLRYGPTAIRFRPQEPYSPFCPVRMIRATNRNKQANTATTLYDYPGDFLGEVTVYGNGCICLFVIPDTVPINDAGDTLSGKLRVEVNIVDNDDPVFRYTKVFQTYYLDTGEWVYNFEDIILKVWQDRTNAFLISFTVGINPSLEPDFVDLVAKDDYILFEKDNIAIPFLEITDGKLTMTVGV